MNPDLIRLIESNGLTLHGDIEYFAHLVAEAEREACARICAALAEREHQWANPMGAGALWRCAAAIRAREQA